MTRKVFVFATALLALAMLLDAGCGVAARVAAPEGAPSELWEEVRRSGNYAKLEAASEENTALAAEWAEWLAHAVSGSDALRHLRKTYVPPTSREWKVLVRMVQYEFSDVTAVVAGALKPYAIVSRDYPWQSLNAMAIVREAAMLDPTFLRSEDNAVRAALISIAGRTRAFDHMTSDNGAMLRANGRDRIVWRAGDLLLAAYADECSPAVDAKTGETDEKDAASDSGACPLQETVLQHMFKDVIARDGTQLPNTYNVLARRFRGGHHVGIARWALALQPEVAKYKVARSAHGHINALHAYPTVAWFNAASLVLQSHTINRITGNRDLRVALESLALRKLPADEYTDMGGDSVLDTISGMVDDFQKKDSTSRGLSLTERREERTDALNNLQLAVHQARVMAARVLAAISTRLDGAYGENLAKVKRENKQGAWMEASFYAHGAGVPDGTLAVIDEYAAQAAAQGPGMREPCAGQTDSREAVWKYVLKRCSSRVKASPAVQAVVDAVLHNDVLHTASPAWTAVRTWYSAVNPRRQIVDALSDKNPARAARAARAVFEYTRWSKEDGHVKPTRSALYNLLLTDDVTAETVKWAARAFMYVHSPLAHELAATEEIALTRAVTDETAGDADLERNYVAKRLTKYAFAGDDDKRASMRHMLLRWLATPEQPDDVYIRLAGLLAAAPSAATPRAITQLVTLFLNEPADPGAAPVLMHPDTSINAIGHAIATIGLSHSCTGKTATSGERCRAITRDARLDLLRTAVDEYATHTLKFAEGIIADAVRAGDTKDVELALLDALERVATRSAPEVELANDAEARAKQLRESETARVVYLFSKLHDLSAETAAELGHFGGKLLLQPAVAVLREHALRDTPSLTAVGALDRAFSKAMEAARVPAVGPLSLWLPDGIAQMMKHVHKSPASRTLAFSDHDMDGDDVDDDVDADEEMADGNGARMGVAEAERVFAQVIVDVVFAAAYRPAYARALFAKPEGAWLPLKFTMRLQRVLKLASAPHGYESKTKYDVKHALNKALDAMSLTTEVGDIVFVWRKLNNLATQERYSRTPSAGRSARAFARLFLPGTIWPRAARELVGNLAHGFARAKSGITSADRSAMCTVMRAFAAEQELVVDQYADTMVGDEKRKKANELRVRSQHYFRAVQWLLYKQSGGDGKLGEPLRNEFAKCLGSGMLDAVLETAATDDADERAGALRTLDTISTQLTVAMQQRAIAALLKLADVGDAPRRRAMCQVLDGFHADAFTKAHLATLSAIVRTRVFTEGRMTGSSLSKGKMVRRWGAEAMPFAHVLARAIRSTHDEVRIAAAQAWLDNAWPTVPKDMYKGLMDVAMRVPSRDARMVAAIRRQFPTVTISFSKEVSERFYKDVLTKVADETALRPYVAAAWTHVQTWEAVDKVSAPVELRELGNNYVTRRDLERIATGRVGSLSEETVALARRMLDVRMYPLRRVDVLVMNEQSPDKGPPGDKHYKLRRSALQRYCVRHTAPQKSPYWMTLTGVTKAVPAAYKALQSAGNGLHTSVSYILGDSSAASKRRVAREEAQKLKARGIKADAPDHVKAGIGYLLYESESIAYGAWPALKRIDTRHIGCRDSDNRTMAIDVQVSRPQGGSFTRRTRTTGEEDRVPYLAIDTLVHDFSGATTKATAKTTLMQIESPDTKGNHGLGLSGVDGVVALHGMWNAAKRFSYGYVMAFQEAYRKGPSEMAMVGMRATMSALGDSDFANNESADMDATTSPESLVSLFLRRKKLDVRKDVHMSRVIEFTNGKPDSSTTNFVVFADRSPKADVTTRREEVVLTRVASGGAKTWDLQLPNRDAKCPQCVARQTFFQGSTDTMKQLHWYDEKTGLVWKTVEKDLAQQRAKMRAGNHWKGAHEKYLPTSREFSMSLSTPKAIELFGKGGAKARVHNEALRNVWLPAVVRTMVPVERFVRALDEKLPLGGDQTLRFAVELKANSKDGKMRGNDRRTVTVTSSAGHRLRVVQEMRHFDEHGKVVDQRAVKVEDRVQTAVAFERAGTASEQLAARVEQSRVKYTVQTAQGRKVEAAVEVYDAYDKNNKRVLAPGAPTSGPHAVPAQLLRAVTTDAAAGGKLVYVTPQQAAANMKGVLESIKQARPSLGAEHQKTLAEGDGLYTAAHMARVTLTMERVNKYLGGAAGKLGTAASAYEWLYKGSRLVDLRDWRAVAAHSAQAMGIDLGRIDASARAVVRGIDSKLGRADIDASDLPPTRAFYKRQFGPFALHGETQFADFAAKHKYNPRYALMIRAREAWVNDALTDAAEKAKKQFTDSAASAYSAADKVKKGVAVVNGALKALQEATELYTLMGALERGESHAAFAYMMKKGPVVANLVIDQFKKSIKAELDVMNAWAKSYVQRNGAQAMAMANVLEFSEREFALAQLEDATKVLGVVTGTWDVLKEGTKWLELHNKRGREFDTFVAGTKASLGGLTVGLSAAGLATTPVGWALAVVGAADAVHSHVESTKIAPLQISSPILAAK